MKSKDVGVDVCMNGTEGSSDELKDPLSLFETGTASLSQAGILMSIRRCSDPSVAMHSHQ